MEWGNDDRVLVYVAIKGVTAERTQAGSNVKREGVEYTARRVLSVSANDGSAVVMFQDERNRMRGSMDLGRVIDLLPNEPDHVLMAAWERDGVLGLHRVNITTGSADRIERGGQGTYGWQTLGGVPVMRFDINSRGTMQTIYARAPGEIGRAHV